MRPLLRTTAVVIAAIALTGCPHKQEPVPGPQSAVKRDRPAVSEINWFQGTLEEAFARPRPSCPGSGAAVH
jgi:hypothetical protein